jgi:nuclear pore complex protein Nup88
MPTPACRAQRAKQLQEEVGAQRRRLGAAESAAAAAAEAADALDARAERLLRLQRNLSERLRLLAELHWALPRPPSRAERAFAARQLPAAEEAAAALRDDAAALRARAAALRRRLRSLGEAAAGAAALSGAAPAVPPHQLRRVREALAEQEAQIAANQQRLAVLEEAVTMAAAVRG